MNQCTILLEDGRKIVIQGESWKQDFDTMSSEDLVVFVKTHLEQIKKQEASKTDEWDYAADGRVGSSSSPDRDSQVYS